MLLNYDLIWNKVIDLPWCTLVASGRTGSDAFQSYLDSHPEIFLIPGSIWLHGFWKRSDSASFYGDLNAEDIVDEFIGHHIRKFKTKYDTCRDEDLFFSYRRSVTRGQQDYGRELSAITLVS